MKRAVAFCLAMACAAGAAGQDEGGDFAASKGSALEAQLEARLKAAVRTVPGTATQYLIGGYAQLDGILARKQQEGDEQDTFFVSATPFGPAEGTQRVSVRQSQINWLSRTPTAVGHVWSRLEANLFPLDGTTAPTLNQLFVRLDDRIVVGKTYSTFMDEGMLPTTLDYNGPGGVTFVRQLQARVAFPFGEGWSIQGAVEDPQADLAGGGALVGVASDARRPDLAARVRREGGFGHVQLAGLSRSIDVTATSPFGSRERHVSGSGVSVSGSIAAFGDDTILWQTVTGKGIGRYFNDPISATGVGLASDGSLETLRTSGATLYYRRMWTPDWMTVDGASTLRIDADGALRRPEELERIVYASANLVHRLTPVPAFTMLGNTSTATAFLLISRAFGFLAYRLVSAACASRVSSGPVAAGAGGVSIMAAAAATTARIHGRRSRSIFSMLVLLGRFRLSKCAPMRARVLAPHQGGGGAACATRRRHTS